MNLLARRDNELPMELERTFPGVDEFIRNIFGPLHNDMLHQHHNWGPVQISKWEKKKFRCSWHVPDTNRKTSMWRSPEILSASKPAAAAKKNMPEKTAITLSKSGRA